MSIFQFSDEDIDKVLGKPTGIKPTVAKAAAPVEDPNAGILDAIQDPVYDLLPGGREGLTAKFAAPIIEPVETLTTAIGTLFRTALPKVVGGVVGGTASAVEGAMSMGLAGGPAGPALKGAYDAMAEPGESAAVTFARVMNKAANDESISSGERTLASVFGGIASLAPSVRGWGTEVQSSYLGYDGPGGRWITMSEEQYFKDVLEDPNLSDPTNAAGNFIGNALASAAPSLICVAFPASCGAVMSSYFPQGFLGAANSYIDDAKEKGESVDGLEMLAHGVGGGTIELLTELFFLKFAKGAIEKSGIDAQLKARLGKAMLSGDKEAAKSGVRQLFELGKIPLAGGAEEIVVSLTNNTRELMTFRFEELNKGGFWDGVGLFTEGSGEAFLGGAIGGGGIAAVGAGLNAPGVMDVRRKAAREEADKLRRTLPSEGPAPLSEEQRQDRNTEGPPSTADPATSLQRIFDGNKSKEEIEARIQEERDAQTGAIPKEANRADSTEELVSDSFVQDFFDNFTDLALALVRGNTGARRIRGYDWFGLVANSGVRSNESNRAAFIGALKKENDRRTRQTSPADLDQPALDKQAKDLSKIPESERTATQESRLERLKEEQERRKLSAEEDTEADAIEAEVEAEVAVPTAPAPAAEAAAPAAAPAPAAEAAAPPPADAPAPTAEATSEATAEAPAPAAEAAAPAATEAAPDAPVAEEVAEETKEEEEARLFGELQEIRERIDSLLEEDTEESQEEVDRLAADYAEKAEYYNRQKFVDPEDGEFYEVATTIFEESDTVEEESDTVDEESDAVDEESDAVDEEAETPPKDKPKKLTKEEKAALDRQKRAIARQKKIDAAKKLIESLQKKLSAMASPSEGRMAAIDAEIAENQTKAGKAKRGKKVVIEGLRAEKAELQKEYDAGQSELDAAKADLAALEEEALEDRRIAARQAMDSTEEAVEAPVYGKAKKKTPREGKIPLTKAEKARAKKFAKKQTAAAKARSEEKAERERIREAEIAEGRKPSDTPQPADITPEELERQKLIRERSRRKPVKSMSINQIVDELIEVIDPGGGKEGARKARMRLVLALRRAGIKVHGQGGKPQLQALLQEFRDGKPLFASKPALQQRAMRMGPERIAAARRRRDLEEQSRIRDKVATKYRRMTEEELTKEIKRLRQNNTGDNQTEARTRLIAALANRRQQMMDARESKRMMGETEEQTQRRRAAETADRKNRTASEQTMRERQERHESFLKPSSKSETSSSDPLSEDGVSVRSVEAGRIVTGDGGRNLMGGKQRSRNVVRLFGRDGISLGGRTDAIEGEEADTRPRVGGNILARIEENLDPNSGPVETIDDLSLEEIDNRFGSNFSDIFEDGSQDAIALARELVALVNRSADLGQQARNENDAIRRLAPETAAEVEAEQDAARENAERADRELAELGKEAGESAKRDREAAERMETDRRKKAGEKAPPSPESIGVTTDDIIDAESTGDEYYAWSQGSSEAVVLPDENVEDIMDDVSIWHRAKMRIRGIGRKITPEAFQTWLSGRISEEEDAISRQEVPLEEAEKGLEGAVRSAAGKRAGLKKGDLEIVPDSQANKVEQDVIRRQRLRGRRVVLYRATNERGIQFNGFVSSDSNTIYVRVSSLGPNTFNGIKDARARRAIEREYQRIVLQIVRHENIHLMERDPGEEGEAYIGIVDGIASVIVGGNSLADSIDSPELALVYAKEVLGMSEEQAQEFAKSKRNRELAVSEIRAEVGSQIDLLRESGGESLLVSRNIIERTVDRFRRIMARLPIAGSQVKAISLMAEREATMATVASALRASEIKLKPGETNLRFSMFGDALNVAGARINEWGRSASLTGVREQMQDSNIRLRKVMAALEKDAGLDFKTGVHQEYDVMGLLDILPGIASVRQKSFADGEWNDLIQFVAEEKLNEVLLGEYLHAKHAAAANAHIREVTDASRDSGMTDTQAEALIAEVEGRSDAEAYKKAHKMLTSMASENLDMMLDAGLITQKEYDDIRAKYGDEYVPLMDAIRDEEDATENVHSSQPTDARGMQRRTGRDAETENIRTQRDAEGGEKVFDEFYKGVISNIKNQRGFVIRKGIQTKAMNRLINTVMEVDDAVRDFSVTAVPRRKDGTFDRSAFKDTPHLFVRLDDSRSVTNSEGVPAIYEKGQLVAITAVRNSKLGKALSAKSIGLSGAGGKYRNHVLMKGAIATVRGFTSIKRSLATEYNPGFILKNVLRDIPEAMTTLRSEGYVGEGKKLIKYFGGAVPVIFKFMRTGEITDPTYREYVNAGGRQSFYRIQGMEESRATLDKELKAARNGGRTLNDRNLFMRWTLGMFSDLTNTFDDAVRFATFKVMKDNGLTTEKAIGVSRDVTVDFSRKGKQAWVNEIYAFSNVGSQGIEKFFRKLRTPSGAVSAMYPWLKFAMIEQAAVALLMDDDEYDAIPDHIKKQNAIIPIGNGDYLTLPLQFGVNIFHEGFRNMVRFASGKGDASTIIADGAASVSQLNPFATQVIMKDLSKRAQVLQTDIGGYSINKTGLLQALMPDILDPSIPLFFTNTDWLGRDIARSPYLKDGQPASYEARKPRTPEIFEGVAKLVNNATGGGPIDAGWLDFPPEFYSFAFSNMAFGVGNEGIRVMERIADMFTGTLIPESPNDLPVVRGLLRSGKEDMRRFHTGHVYDLKSDYDSAVQKERDLKNLAEEERVRITRDNLDQYTNLNEWDRLSNIKRRVEAAGMQKYLKDFTSNRRKLAALGDKAAKDPSKQELYDKQVEKMDKINARISAFWRKLNP